MYEDELNDLMDARDSSLILQKKCALLFLLTHLTVDDVDFCLYLLQQVTISMLEKVNFETRFPIQEKYFACLYNLLLH